eukprot:198916-Pleurochrysis_carterae.AAC.3
MGWEGTVQGPAGDARTGAVTMTVDAGDLSNTSCCHANRTGVGRAQIAADLNVRAALCHAVV